MRRALIAGNWKMNLDRAGAAALAQAVAEGAAGVPHVDLLICPPHVYLEAARSSLAGTSLALGAQNMHAAASGAFTGEISPAMLIDLGCRYVILGHSERRQLFGETDEIVNRKVLAALQSDLLPIVCVGETLQDREAGKTYQVVQEQCIGSLASVTPEQLSAITLAYEPVWAIGTGKVATPQQAQEVHAALRKLLRDRYNPQLAEGVRILYGGSMKSDNAGELLSQADVDGGLVGGASLKAVEFLAIAKAAPVAG